jgi:hypothetical protein
MPMAIEMITTKGTEIGFLEQQHANRDHRAGHRQERFLQIVHVRHLAYRVVGGVEHGKQFHQLGRLQIGDAHRQPAARPVDIATDTRNQDQREQNEPADKQPGEQAVARWSRAPGRSIRQRSSRSHQENGMAHQKVGRMITGHVFRPRQWPSMPSRPSPCRTAAESGCSTIKCQIDLCGQARGVESSQHQAASLSTRATDRRMTSARCA